jgi:hypothetical protein
MPGPGPQGLVSQHIRQRRRRGRWDGGEEDSSCQRRTTTLRAGRTGVRGSVTRQHRAGAAGSGQTNTFPSGPAEPRLAESTRTSMVEVPPIRAR